MSLLFDLILVLILTVCAFIGYKHGLVHTLSKFISAMISFTLANKFYVLLAKLFIQIPLLESMAAEKPFAESMTCLDRIASSIEIIKENLTVFGDQATMTEAEAIVDHAVAVLIASCFAFVATFIIAMLLMKLLLVLLDGFVTKIPVLKQINGVLGGIFGLFNGLFWTWLITNAFVSILLPTLSAKFPSLFVQEIADSVIVQLCTKINPVTYIIGLINFIFH